MLFARKTFFISIVFVVYIVSILALPSFLGSKVNALNGFIDPNGDGSTGNWTSTGGTFYTEVDEAVRQPVIPNVIDSISGAANNGGSVFLNMNSILGATSVSAVTVWIYHNDGTNGQIGVQLFDDDEVTTRSGEINMTQSATSGWHQVTFSGLGLTQTELDSLSISLHAQKNGGGPSATIQVYAMYADVTYSNLTVSLEQSGFRFFSSLNSTDVGTPLAAQNTAAVLNASGDEFRLRTLLHVNILSTGLGVSGKDFKLQFVDRGAGSCATPSGGTPASYTDVTGASAIAYNNLAGGVNDGDALTTNVNDPAHGGDAIIAQTVEESNNFTNSQGAIGIGEDGLWDFALIDNSGTSAATFCFRVVESDGTLLGAYPEYPQVTTGNGVLSVDIVDSLDVPVASPSFPMDTSNYLFNCDATATTLGDSSQRIEISNFTATPAWNVTIAATAGAGTVWSDGGTNSYDYNDSSGAPPGCSDGADGDLLAGQLSVDSSVGANTPRAGCTDTGVTFGASSAFSEGVTDSITIATASSGAEVSCSWQLTDIAGSQQLPQDQASGSYTINLTLTVTAI